jgi:hypothetical protein
VARVTARVASGRGGVGHGDGDRAAAAQPGDGLGHGEVIAEALHGLGQLRADHRGGPADGVLGGVDSAYGVLDGAGGALVTGAGEAAELGRR